MLKRVGGLPENETAEAQPEADFRGAYGYGRRAHRPDPDARYGFAPEPDRPLTPEEHYVLPSRAGGGEKPD